MYRICLVICILLSGVSGLSAQNMRFDILGGRDRIEVPFKMTHNFIVVEMRLFGMLPLNFIFDTGAENTILLTRQFADFIGTEYDLRIPILGSDMSQKVYALVARSIEVELIGLPPQRKDILVLEENHFNLTEITGVQIDGILGGNFFKNSVVEIDYRRQRIIFHNPQTFKKPRSSFRMIPIEVENNKPYVNITADLTTATDVELKLLLDTGAGLPLLLNTNSHPSLELPEDYIVARLGIGLGGYIEGYVGRIVQLHLAEMNFNQVLTSFQDISTTLLEKPAWIRNGLIGNQLLSRLRVIIDYVHEELYINPLSGYKQRFKMDKSGLIIVATGMQLDNFVVRDVIPESPAGLSGLQSGDVIVKLQKLPAHGFSLDQITRLLQKKDGKRIRLTIKRDGEILKKEFRLKELI